MRLFMFRALITIDAPAPAASRRARTYHTGTRALLVHASRPGHPAQEKFFQTMMTWDEDSELGPGDHAIVTLTIADEQAPSYLDSGQPFTLWGSASGHGVITRRVYTTGSPS